MVEPINKIIKFKLKRKLDASKGAWMDELSVVLWVIWTTSRTVTWETPFSMGYRSETMSLIEVGPPSLHRIYFNELSNDKLRRCELNFLKEMSDESQTRLNGTKPFAPHYPALILCSQNCRLSYLLKFLKTFQIIWFLSKR